MTSRLKALIGLLQALDDDEFRMLPAVLSEQILARERQRAKQLLRYVGRSCDVVWPGQAEASGVLLIGADPETGIACVQHSSRGRRLDVPACTVVIQAE